MGKTDKVVGTGVFSFLTLGGVTDSPSTEHASDKPAAKTSSDEDCGCK